jgi:hypothetical protein
MTMSVCADAGDAHSNDAASAHTSSTNEEETRIFACGSLLRARWRRRNELATSGGNKATRQRGT